MMAYPTMFQCMIRSDGTCFHLRSMLNNAYEDDCVCNVRPRVPGSLGQDIPDCTSGEWVIGSLAMNIHKVSVFVFQNGKIKISGGSKSYQPEDDYEDWLRTKVIVPVMLVVHKLNGTLFRQDTLQWDLCLLNGSMTLGPLRNYRQLCTDICAGVAGHPFFESAIMPVCYQPNGWLKKRGRVCSVALRWSSSTNKKGSILRFDHGGRVQFFAVKSVDELRRAGTELQNWTFKLMH